MADSAGAQTRPEALHRGDFTPRLAIIKFPRTGSTLMMKRLEDVVCSSKACEELWVPEIFDQICPATADCDAKAALSLIRRHSSCSGGGGCGWSLNLFKHQHAGLRMWPEIVKVMAAQPMTVVFLTRKDPIAQVVSYAVGTERKALLKSAEAQHRFGAGVCSAYQFYNCPPQVVEWVNNRTYFDLDLRQMNDEVLRSQRETRTYKQLEADLRKMALPNLNIIHTTYEDLHQKDAWNKIFEAVGRPAAEAPKMVQSNYSRFISNWANVVAYSRLKGL